MASVAVVEKGLTSRIEIVLARTRVSESPYYTINSSGRVSCLVRNDGVSNEEFALAGSYSDHLGSRPGFDPPVQASSV